MVRPFCICEYKVSSLTVVTVPSVCVLAGRLWSSCPSVSCDCPSPGHCAPPQGQLPASPPLAQGGWAEFVLRGMEGPLNLVSSGVCFTSWLPCVSRTDEEEETGSCALLNNFWSVKKWMKQIVTVQEEMLFEM